MQVQVRNPIAVEVNSAGDDGAVHLQFFTAADHQVAVTLSGDLAAELFEQLNDFLQAGAEQEAQAAKESDVVAEEKPAPVKQRMEFFAAEQKPVKLQVNAKAPANAQTRPQLRAREPVAAEQPILRALLQV